MKRPFFKDSIETLEAAFDEKQQDLEFLNILKQELGHRESKRAKKLGLRVNETLATSHQVTTKHTPITTPTITTAKGPWVVTPKSTKPTEFPKSPVTLSRPLPIPAPMPPPTAGMVNAATEILSAWTALEVLSPQSFKKPEDLASGDKRAVASLQDRFLPWEGGIEKARPKTRLYYQIILGTVHLEPAISLLLSRYADKRVEQPSIKGEGILAVVVVDKTGKLLDPSPAAISSFAWGLPNALSEDFRKLAEWERVEKILTEELDKKLRIKDSEGNDTPLTHATIQNAYEWLTESLGIQKDLTKAPYFAIRNYQPFSNGEPPDPLLLNSFFLSDLARARNLFGAGQANESLSRYLGMTLPNNRINLLENNEALERVIAPDRIPSARWPTNGRHPLVMLQQAAVNIATSELANGGILAVNGPPGTGKTTLLRDIVAAQVSKRAEIMCQYKNPADAFHHSSQKIKAGQGWLHLYTIDSKLKGFEILVASSNNKAVENVSAELPNLNAIASDATNLRYFKTLSDNLLNRETWGLAAAVLGNLSNRSHFKQKFWWDEDFGLSTYLAQAAGTPQEIEIKDPETEEILEVRPPKIVINENPPKTPEEALRRWAKVKNEFTATLQKSQAQLDKLEKIRSAINQHSSLKRKVAEFEPIFQATSQQEAEQKNIYELSQNDYQKAQEELNAFERLQRIHRESKPSLLARLLPSKSTQVWNEKDHEIASQIREASFKHADSYKIRSENEKNWRQAKLNLDQLKNNYLSDKLACEQAEALIAEAYQDLSKHIIDEEFFLKDHKEKHLTSPWCDEQIQRIRDDVFIAAINTHKAFIDAAAKPLRHNLGALMTVFSGRAMQDAEKSALLKDLWASLFLVVPAISTTFASIDRMLGQLTNDSIGWLLIDEAGQALPQAAVGAIMRSKRAIIVGDPIQIEPVVVLPNTLTQVICKSFDIDPDRFNAPEASCQTLADAATDYYAEFQSKQGSRTVGVPLLVHRRCSEPMFSISNNIAYERLMVNAKVKGQSTIRDVLGSSQWIDVHGGSQDKWCPEEGEAVLKLLLKLKELQAAPDLYIVTPFVIVADNLRKIIRESGILNQWTDDPYKWTFERVGTVHTVQGREAEAVIFVLGAPNPQQFGARNWAGGRPNLLNVAVTRAKEAVYVVGNRDLWKESGLFKELHSQL